VIVSALLAGPLAAQDALEGARTEYAEKRRQMTDRQVADRIALATWCVEKELWKEAEVELQAAARMNPEDTRLFDAWTKLAAMAPQPGVRVKVTTTDGTTVEGICSARAFVIRHDPLVTMLPLAQMKGLKVVRSGPRAATVEAVLPQGDPVTGTIRLRRLRLDTDTGRKSVALNEIAELTVGEVVEPVKPPPTWPEVLAELNEGGLDIVIVFDATGDMARLLEVLRKRIKTLVATLAGLVDNVRVGMVAFRDEKRFDPTDFEFDVRSVGLQAPDEEGLKALTDFLKSMRAFGGGDRPEGVYDGLKEAVMKPRWRRKSRKFIILVGDAPPHAEDRGLFKVYSLAKNWQKREMGTIHCIHFGSDRILPEFQRIAREGGGGAFPARDERQLFTHMLIGIFGPAWKDPVQEACAKILEKR
jgi:hypothetical protein